MTRKMKLSFCITFLLSLSGCGAGGGGGDVAVVDQGNGTALVLWSRPYENEDGSTLDDLAGFRIYYGNASDGYINTVTIDNENMTSYQIENLGEADWYFAMTAFNSLGIESAYSEEVHKAIK
jgi:hypothetical protein